MLWLIQPVSPALILLLGILALLVLNLSPWHRQAPIAAISANVIALIALIALRSPRAAFLVGRPWSSVLFDAEGGIAWQVNTWTWSGGALILHFSLVVILVAWDAGGRLTPYYRAADLALAATALMVTFSANLLTLVSMWVLMESVALARLTLEPTYEPETGRMGLSAASVLLMALACALSGPALLTIPLAGAALPPLVQGLLVAAIALRAAVYPLHGWLTHSRMSHPADRLAVYLIPATTGLWLLGQINSTEGMGWISAPQWLVPIALSLFGSAITAWAEPSPVHSLDLIYANRAGAILLTMALWPSQGAIPLVGWLLAFSLGLSLLLVADLINQAWGGRWPGVLAVLTLIGYPATVGFMGQTWTARLAPPSGQIAFWIATVLADGFLLAALLRSWQRPSSAPPERVSGREGRLLAAAVLLAAPMLFLSLQPGGILHAAGMAVAPANLLALMASTPAVVWARLLVISALALWLHFGWQPASSQWRHLQVGLARVTRVDWVYGLAQHGIRSSLAFWQSMLHIVEGDGYVGWVALTLLLLWLLFR